MGTIYYQLHDQIECIDEKNGLVGIMSVGPQKKSSWMGSKSEADSIEGTITQHGKVVSKIKGNYCGYMDIDGQRWYDEREVGKIWREYKPVDESIRLPSDSTIRDDLQLLAIGDMNTAQAAKEKIEDIQRKDLLLRERAAKRRAEGGRKIVYKYSEIKE